MRHAVLSLVLLAACAPGPNAPPAEGSPPRADAGPPAVFDGAAPPPPTDPVVPTPADAGAPDATCGSAAIPVTRHPPRILVLFDRSCSMRRLVDGSSPTTADDPNTRFQVARRAVERQVDRHGDRVHWGMMLIPELEHGCEEVPTVRVVPGPGRQDRMRRVFAKPRVNPYLLCGDGRQPLVTPTLGTLEAAADDPTWRVEGPEHFALLVTDGASGCGSTVATLEATTRRLRDLGVRTAVVGFGPEATSDGARTKLDAVAQAGGLPAGASSPHYYVAGDAGALDAALDRIVDEAVSCRFGLEAPPPDPARLFVFVDGAPLARDAADGWSYDAAGVAVELTGDACGRLRRGEVTRVNVVYGCPIPACEPQAERCDGLDEDCDDVIDEGCLR